MKVNVYFNGKKKDKKDYQYKVIEKLVNLGCFLSWHKYNNDISIYGGFANDDMIIKIGLIQIVLKDIAFFGGGEENKPLYLRLEYGSKWQDVWDKIKNIDSIEYEVKDN